MKMAYLSALAAGVGFFVTSVTWLGVWPARVLEEQARALGPETMMALTPSEQRGRDVYAREGCAYCHTQQVRFTAADQARFGAPTLAWEGRRDYPHMLGTRRIGPDLARMSGAYSEDWHLAHLFDPRLIVPESVMPAYRHLFDGTVTRPRQEARDLVAYLDSLGRARRLAAGADSAGLDAHPARVRTGGMVPALEAGGSVEVGGRLYSLHCAGCHGVAGRGDGPAAVALRPAPASLGEHEYTRARLAEALWHGVPGTAMPAWRDRTPAELSALAEYVRALGRTRAGGDQAPAEAGQVARGAQVYVEHCAQCHGEEGGGDGWAVALQIVRPTSFQQQRPTLDLAVRVLERGVDGTMMAAWGGRLSPGEIVAVAHYVRTLYRED